MRVKLLAIGAILSVENLVIANVQAASLNGNMSYQAAEQSAYFS